MANSKPKFIIKLNTLLFSSFILVLLLTLAANIILASSKEKITQILNSRFFKPVTIKNIFYLPPNFIVLNDLSISENAIKTDKKIISVPLSCALFSVLDLFLNKTVDISSLYCIGFTTDLNDLVVFLKDNPVQILDFIKRLPKHDFALTVSQITIKSILKNMPPVKTKGDFRLKIKNKAVTASGSVGRNVFSFKGILRQEQVIVENFKLVGGNIDCQFWGELSPSLAEFRGFILADLSLLNIDSRIKLAFPRVEIERLNFLINDNPVQVTADILLNQPFSCNLKLFSRFRGMGYKPKGMLKNVTLIASIIDQEDKTVKVNGSLNIDFPEQKKESLPLEKIELNLKDLVLNFKEFPALKITAAGLNLSSKTNTDTYNLNLEELQGAIHELANNLKLVNFSSRFYDGFLQGRACLEMHDFIPTITAVIKTENVTAGQLEGRLIHFSKIDGKLSSQMSFANYPQLLFKGTIYLRDGSLNNAEFLKWLANSFNLPSLQTIYFNTASTDFIVNREGAEMYNMDLDSENVKIKGYFKLKENDLIASKIFVSLRRELLEKSPNFTPLLNLLDTKQELVKFNFQLSGNFHGMNFQWLKSDFKDDLQKTIPNFAKSNFEEKIGGIIESILKE
jgi:hypothetical protein